MKEIERSCRYCIHYFHCVGNRPCLDFEREPGSDDDLDEATDLTTEVSLEIFKPKENDYG